ncbi:hypothetical protein WR52_29635 (plasmid) [Bacillus cereus]|uniref:nSTAND3 domain-containing NTPase n=1 Tax=Bacillus cereus TaxID=1396 RepID=UPI0007B6EAA4|nr:hypothetical protein [Bacillus cereus]ANC22873.1 hypothetical protein WR52_29635 [Bacillus cereus]
MSVEKVGPQGYEYQYLVSVFMALKLIHKDNMEIFIESENGEDLQIQFDENEKTYIIDVQVKKRDKQIDLVEFSKWISHFENRSNDANLFTKLYSEESRFVLYVTNSRCKDEVSHFIDNDTPINSSLEVGLSDELINKIKINTLNNYNQSKSLSMNRYSFLKDFFEQIKNNQLRNILKKNRVWDLHDYDFVLDKISRLLNQKFFVPQSKVEETTLKLIELIKLGRDSQNSISSNIVELLTKYKGTRIFDFDAHLINRTEKEECKQMLSSNNVLLLTGVSFCGKTYLAKEIAQEYQDTGFTIKVTNELRGDNGGFSFLRHISHEDRLLVLEDPFGGVITSEKALEITGQVKELIENSNSHRKIIITTRKDILLDAMNKESLNECRIDGNAWFDLSVENENFEKEIWFEYFGESTDSTKLFNEIREWLNKNEKIGNLQPGQIVHLYKSQGDIKELQKINIESIIRMARVDSNQLADKINQRGIICKKIYVALGLSCNTYKSIHLEHLSFILSDVEESPSIAYESEIDFSIEYSFFEESKEVEYPTYSENNKIEQKYITELRYLQRHGYIKIDNLMRTVIFTHPIYHFASKILFEENVTDLFDSDEVLKIVNRSLGALSKSVNICALMMLEAYYEKTEDTVIKKIMLKSLHSIYPSVRDRVIMFFDSRIDKLNKVEAEEFINFIGYLKIINDNVILWKNGDPYFSTLNKRKFSSSKAYNDNKKYLNKIQEKIKKDEVLSSEEMWNILNSSIVINKESNSLQILRQCLTYDEAFIREKAIFHLFQDYAYDLANIAVYLDPHEHPNVIYKLFRGALGSWNKYKHSRKTEIIEFYKGSLNVVSVAIRSLRFLENFEDQYIIDGINWSELSDIETTELWLVWHDIFVKLLNDFPSKYIVMDEAHMVNVARSSLKFIKNQEKVIELTNAWIRWLDKYSHYYLSKDHGMSVAKYLMDGTKGNYELRKDVFQDLLKSPKTSFITTNIHIIVDYWDYLSKYERQLVLSLLNSERKDLKWIKAVVLNNKEIPSDVQIAIFGEALFEKNSDEIVDKLIESSLIEFCINIHCGFPQPLWWNGYHHNNYEVWDKVIEKILSGNNYDRTFQIALREFIDNLYNHDTRRFADSFEFLQKELLNNEEKRALVFNRLLFETIAQNQANKKLWMLLLTNSSMNEQREYLDKIAEYIEAVQYYHTNYDDLHSLFDKSIIYNEIYPRIKKDFEIYKCCINLLQIYEDIKKIGGEEDELCQKVVQTFRVYIKKNYDITPPRMSLTDRYVLYTMKALKIEDMELQKKIKENSMKQFKIREKLATEFDDHYEIEDWIY